MSLKIRKFGHRLIYILQRHCGFNSGLSPHLFSTYHMPATVLIAAYALIQYVTL